MAIITSRAVGVNTAANKPTASTAGRLYFENDTLLGWYDNGSSWVPWEFGMSVNLFQASGVAGVRTVSPSTTPTWDSWGGANQVTIVVRDFTRFRWARLVTRYIAVVGTVTLRCRDLTNNVNIGSAPALSSVTWATDIGAWTALNGATTGDIPFEIQMQAATGGDGITVGTIGLELK